MKWVLNVIYATLLLILSPVVIWRNLRHGRYRRGWQEKLLGMLPTTPADCRVVWFHAVSVGEVLQLQKVIEAFRHDTGGRFHIVVTTSTDTGYELATERFTGCTATWFPLDFSWAVSTALKRIRPEMVVLMELELWPNFLKTCEEKNVTTALVNARMSDRSFTGYSRFKRLITPVFRQFSVVGTQTSEYADRLKKLGCPEEAVRVTGSVKFDGVLTDRSNEQTQQLRRLFSISSDDLTFIAGSTQDPEEETALKVWQALQKSHPELRLILVPRHRERFDAVAQMVTNSGLDLCRRSQLHPDDVAPRNAVILLDTIGELTACWGLADIAFVGGSFGSRGGQNMLEPAAFGAAVMFGPNTWNFRDIVSRLKEADAAIQLTSTDDMLPAVDRLLQDPETRLAYGSAAGKVVLSQQGAVTETVRLLTAAVDTDRKQQPESVAA